MKSTHISLPIATVGTIIVAIIAGAAAYYGTVNAQNQKVSDAKAELNLSISDDRQRISALEANYKTISDAQTETRNDVKEILRRVK